MNGVTRRPADGVITPDRRTHFLAHIWRWRHELVLGTGLATICAVVLTTFGMVWGTVALSAMAGVCSPPWPRWLDNLAWRIITPHRIRTGLAQARIRNRDGWQPLVLQVTSTPLGERAILWCPAGTSAEDIYAKRTVLRAACWAADVRVSCEPRHSYIATVDVIRRGEEFSRVNGSYPNTSAYLPLDLTRADSYPDHMRRHPDLMTGRR